MADASTIDQQEQSLVAEQDAARTDLATQRGAEAAPIEAGVKEASAKIDSLASQPAQQLPMPPNTAQHIDPKQMTTAASAFMTLGALAGLLTRQPMTAALNNMTAAMKGVQEGDAEQYDRAYKEFQSNYDKAMKTNKAMLDEKEKALKDTNLTLTARVEQLRLIDAKYGNMGKDLQASFKTRMDLLQSQRKATEHAEDQKEKIREANERIEDHRQDHRDMMELRRGAAGGGAGGGGGLSDNAKDMMADMLKRGIKPPDISGRKEVSAMKMDIVNRMAEKWKQDGSTPSDVQVNHDMQAALSKSLTQVQSRVTGIELGSRKIEKDIQTLDRYMQEGNADHIRLINSRVNSLREMTSDPTLAPYALAVKQVATEYERLLSGGMLSTAQLHAGAAEDAKNILNENMDIATVQKVIPVMLREIQNGRAAANETLTDLRSQIRGVGGAAGAAGAGSPVQTATNPKTGEKLQLVNGQWVPAK